MMNIVEKYIDADYPVFQVSEKACDALEQFQEQEVQVAPVLKDGKLQAFVSAGYLREVVQAKGDVEAELLLEHLPLDEPETVRRDQHILDVFEQLNNNLFSNILAVTGEESEYEGVVVKSGILQEIALLFHFSEAGSTLEIEVPALGVKVSEIISVIEKNDAMVLSFGIVEPEPGAQTMVVTFRVQCQDIFRLVTNLEKYGYLIRYAKPSEGGGVDELREKALEFMRYIDM